MSRNPFDNPFDMPEETHAEARKNDPPTAHDAAARVRISKLEKAVYEFLLAHRGRYMTSVEIAEEMGVDKWSVSPRLRPLWLKGLLHDPIEKAGINSAGNIRNLQAWMAK